MMKMKAKNRQNAFVLAAALGMIIMLAGAVAAHEVWIEIEETDDAELDIKVLWGHFPDQLDPADPDIYTLFVKQPEGDARELPMKPDGNILKATFNPETRGEYLFWAIREPGTYAPQDAPVTLSVQTAKSYFYVGEDTLVQRPVDKAIQIAPDHDMRGFRGGLLSGRILIDGEPAPGATVGAYDDGLHISVTTDEDGVFSLDLDQGGKWLIKANLLEDAGGEIGGEEYGRTSLTATLALNLPEWQSSDIDGHHHDHAHGHHHAGHDHAHDHDHHHGTPIWHALLILVAGILLGSAATLVIVGKKLAAIKQNSGGKSE